MATSSYSGKAPYAAKATDGSNITSGPYGTYTTAKNNNGTIKANGTVSSGVVSSVSTVRPVVTTFASTVIENSVTSKDYAGKGLTSGTFAYNDQRPVGKLVSSTLNGSANTVVGNTGNSGDTIRGINSLVTLRTRRFTTAVRANKYNRVTGTFENGYPVVATDTLATDNAAVVSRAAPGYKGLVFKSGNPVPTTQSYPAKTN